MVKLFFAGISLFVLVIALVATGVLAPLLAGIDSNLGGAPASPFHNPIPAPIMDTIGATLASITPQMWLLGLLALLSISVVRTGSAMIGRVLYHHRQRTERWTLLRFRSGLIAAREADAQRKEQRAKEAAAPAILPHSGAQSLWE